MPEQIRECPECDVPAGDDGAQVEHRHGRMRMECPCGFASPWADTFEECYAVWNQLAAEDPSWWCGACGNNDGFRTVRHTPFGEAADYDVECLECGSLDTAETLVEAVQSHFSNTVEPATDKVESLRRDLELVTARAECAEANHDTVLDEVERLRGWKAEALIVLDRWEHVAEELGVGAGASVAPKELGRGRSVLALDRVRALRRELRSK